MNKIYTILTIALFTISGSLIAQTYHNIDVANNAFTPAQLTINVGDTVLWTNSMGFHNVNGTLQTHPNNPESFGNGTGRAGWSYQFIFTVAGNYTYNCDVHEGMNGSLTVIASTVGISEAENSIDLKFYPNPVNNQLFWEWSDNKSVEKASLTIYDITGKTVDQFSLKGISNRDLSHFAEGLYIYSLVDENGQIQTGKILVSK